MGGNEWGKRAEGGETTVANEAAAVAHLRRSSGKLSDAMKP